jgi:peptidoglycan hydrolase CwlO-like protein
MAPTPPYQPRPRRPRAAAARRAHRPCPRGCRPRALALGAVLAAALTATVAGGVASGSLEGRLDSARAREGQLSAGISADSRQIQGFGGRIEDLRARLQALELSLGVERAFLGSLRAQLASARERLAALKVSLAHDREVLIAQVIAAYESPPPDLATVILEAHGFADLIERVDGERAIARENAAATVRVREEHAAVGVQAAKLATLEASQARETEAVLVQRNEVAQLRLALVERRLQFSRARDRKSAELSSLRAHARKLEGELARQLAATGNGLAYTGPVGAYSAAPEGAYGFFPAPGTNYSVGEEPTLAARLNTLGRALHLHLIGISGYRSPQHSVEVGGYANDPHTRGEASDTPGVEGVPEATLERFGLTRPFPGAAEADHIQLG